MSMPGNPKRSALRREREDLWAQLRRLLPTQATEILRIQQRIAEISHTLGD